MLQITCAYSYTSLVIRLKFFLTQVISLGGRREKEGKETEIVSLMRGWIWRCD